MKRLLFLALVFFPALASAQNVTCIAASPVVDTGGAYASGDSIGGKLTFAGLLRGTVGSGHITGISIADKAGQAVDLDLVVFGTNPTATTFTDQAALTIADADLSKISAIVNFGSASRFAFADNSVHYLGSLALPVVALSSAAPTTTVYGHLIARGAYTGASASDIVVTICALQD